MDMKTVKQWMAEKQQTADELIERTGLDKQVVRHIIDGQWTPSPKQRERVAAALGVAVSEIRWGHSTPVEHMYGHGPQFGRSP